MILFLSFLSLIAIFLFVFAAFSLLKKYGYTNPDSVVYSIVLFYVIYSTLLQFFFLLKIIDYFIFLEVSLILLITFIVIKNYYLVYSSIQDFITFIRKDKVVIYFIIIYLYLFLQALLLPPSTWDCQGYHLPRILMMQREGGLFLNNFNTFNQATFMVGSDILHFLFLRFFSDWFSGIFSFLSYTIIILATYSLVKKVFAEETISILAAITIGSLIEIVLQSTSQNNDIHLTAIATVSFLSAYNFLKRKDPFSLLILVSCMIFGISVKACFIPFVLPFILILIIFCYKELRDAKNELREKWHGYYFLALIPLVSLICLLSFILNNYLVYGHILGDPVLVEAHKNLDGVRGGIVNLLRYTVQMVNLPTQLGGGTIEGKIKEFLSSYSYAYVGVAPVQEEISGLSSSIFSLPQEYLSWYGPFGLFIVIPAILFSLWRGENFLKLISASLVLYAVLICYTVGWVPWYSRIFSLFFGGSGLCIAFFIKRFISSRYYKSLLVINLIILAYAAFLNTDKPLISKHKIGYFLHDNIVKIETVEKKKKEGFMQDQFTLFTWIYYVINRDWYYKRYYHDDRVQDFKNGLKPHGRLLVIAHKNSWVLPFLIKRPDVDIVMGGFNNLTLVGKKINIYNSNDLLYLKTNYDYILFLNLPASLWLGSDRLIMKFDRFVNSEGKLGGETFYLFDYSSVSSRTVN